MKRAVLLLLAIAAWPQPAVADAGMLMGGVADRQMPLDAVAAPTECYSLRRLRTSYVANKAVNIVRASDSATSDIGFLASGSPDVATATTFCNATTCKVTTWYTQCGSRNLAQSTDANRPNFIFTCLGAFPCLRATAAAQLVSSAANFTPATGVVSLSAVVNRSSGTGLTYHAVENGFTGNRLHSRSATAGLALTGGTSGQIATTSTEGSWHAAVGTINGASSGFNVDGTDTTGTVTGNTTAGLIVSVQGAASTTINDVEAAVWDNVALSASQRSYLTTNQRAAWGF